MRKLVYTPNLDLVRALAILLVLFYHVFQRFDYPEVNFFISSGEYGVQLFFVLSGFLIGSLFYSELANKKKVDIKRFIIRRLTRTLPPYFVILALSFLLVFIARKEHFDFRYLFFIQNYLNSIPFFKVSWSLCVEEHFYLILPFVLTLLHIVKKKWIKITIVIVILITPFFLRLVESIDKDLSFGYLTTATHLNIDSMSLGVLFGYLFINTKLVFSLFWKMFFIVSSISLLLLFPYLNERFVYTFGKLILPFLFSCTVFVLVISKQYNISSNKLIVLIAKSSYSTYLTHAFMLNILDKIYVKKCDNVYVDLLVICLTIIVSLVFGYIFYHYIEKKIMVLRDKWSYKL